MYALTGVIQPKLDVAELSALSRVYAALGRAMATAHKEADKAVQQVLASNDGPAAKNFKASETGPDSISVHVDDLAKAAHRTSEAYRGAAKAGGGAQTAMNALAARATAIYIRMVLQGAPPMALASFLQIVRGQLLGLEATGTTGINSAFSHLSLPAPRTVSEPDEVGHLDEKIEDVWADIYSKDPARAHRILQKMADDYAKANNLPPVKLHFVQIPPTPDGDNILGDYDPSTTDIRIDVDYVHDPEETFNTVIHEMDHHRQSIGMANAKLPPFGGLGNMNFVEALKWQVLDSYAVTNKGGYYPTPTELESRVQARDYVNNMTYAEFKKKYL